MTGPTHYCLYRPDTGEIVKSGVCPAQQLELQRRPGLELLSGSAEAGDCTHRVVIPANARPYLRRLTVQQTAARRARAEDRLAAARARLTPEKLLAALKRRGHLTDEDVGG